MHCLYLFILGCYHYEILLHLYMMLNKGQRLRKQTLHLIKD